MLYEHEKSGLINACPRDRRREAVKFSEMTTEETVMAQISGTDCPECGVPTPVAERTEHPGCPQCTICGYCGLCADPGL